MHEGAGDLDESLEVEPVFIAAFEPELLQHIVRFVVVATVETLEISGVAGVEESAARGVQGLDKSRDAIPLQHGARGPRHIAQAQWQADFDIPRVCRILFMVSPKSAKT
jgi:hypothetical protein